MTTNDFSLVSVIIPTYNRAHYLKECIDSVLQQTYTHLEVLIIDDGSTDNTREIVLAMADPRLRYVYQTNSGRSKARNHGLSLAKGKYIAFLDSDDLYLPEKIALQVAYLQNHPGTGMVYTSAYCISASGKLLPNKYEAKTSGLIYEQIAFFVPITITLPTVITYKTIIDSVGWFDENMHRFEDTDLWRRIARSYRIDAMPEYTCKLRSHADNTLINQDPEEITTALKYYTEKILREDNHISLSVRKNGLSQLYMYYASALLTVPAFVNAGKKLFVEANKMRFIPNTLSIKWIKEYANFLLSMLPAWLQIPIRRIYTKCMILFIKTKTVLSPSRIDPKIEVGSEKNLETKFAKVYNKNLFGGAESRSGEGSNLEQTQIIREKLPEIVKKFNIKSFLDAPCGDWYWMRTVELGVEQYIGIDIVDTMIQTNIKNFSSSTVEFLKMNIVNDNLPKTDLIFSRDCLVHLNFSDALKAIANFKRAGATFLLATTFTERVINHDLIGQYAFWRPLNLQLAPFNFPSPQLLINEKCTEGNGGYADKCLGLWLLHDIPCTATNCDKDMNNAY